MKHNVTLHPLARADLFELYDFIAERSGPARAGAYIDRIEALFNSLSNMPDRGVTRPDLGADIRTIAMERRILIVYRQTIDQVIVLRVLYAGRDYSMEDLPV